VPAAVARYLLPSERQVITARYHPALLAGPVAATLVGLFGALLLSALKLSPETTLAVWLAWGGIFLYLIAKVYAWLENYYVITTFRMVVVKGILTRDVEMLPLSSAPTLKLRRTTAGRLFGYGKFILEDVGQDPAVRTINFIPYPEQLYLEVCGLIYPDPGPGPGPGPDFD
jgi:Bacterial PH domain